MLPRALLFILCLWTSRAAAEPVWIDTDPALGAPWREVDDAFALLLAFHSPELQIAGLSTTYGNAGLPRTTTVARDLVRRFGGAAGLTERAVYPGAASPRDHGKKSAATEALARALKHGKLTYVALGPLTNLAALLELHPELAPRIKRVILVGGRSAETRFAFGREKKFVVHDANIFKDPASAAAVLRAGRPLLLAPIELAPEIALTPADLRGISEDGAAGDYLLRRTRAWLWFWTRWVREEGGLAFDVLGVLPAVRPNLLEVESRFARFEANGDLVAYRTKRPGTQWVQFATSARAGATRFILSRLRADRWNNKRSDSRDGKADRAPSGR